MVQVKKAESYVLEVLEKVLFAKLAIDCVGILD